MVIAGGGAVNVVGSLSKGSGSFKIDHPLVGMSTTHNLVHSFIDPMVNHRQILFTEAKLIL